MNIPELSSFSRWGGLLYADIHQHKDLKHDI